MEPPNVITIITKIIIIIIRRQVWSRPMWEVGDLQLKWEGARDDLPIGLSTGCCCCCCCCCYFVVVIFVVGVILVVAVQHHENSVSSNNKTQVLLNARPRTNPTRAGRSCRRCGGGRPVAGRAGCHRQHNHHQDYHHHHYHFHHCHPHPHHQARMAGRTTSTASLHMLGAGMPHGSEVNCLDGPIKLTMMTSHDC